MFTFRDAFTDLNAAGFFIALGVRLALYWRPARRTRVARRLSLLACPVRRRYQWGAAGRSALAAAHAGRVVVRILAAGDREQLGRNVNRWLRISQFRRASICWPIFPGVGGRRRKS